MGSEHINAAVSRMEALLQLCCKHEQEDLAVAVLKVVTLCSPAAPAACAKRAGCGSLGKRQIDHVPELETTLFCVTVPIDEASTHCSCMQDECNDSNLHDVCPLRLPMQLCQAADIDNTGMGCGFELVQQQVCQIPVAGIVGGQGGVEAVSSQPIWWVFHACNKLHKHHAAAV